jgi:dihydroorotate dehydrogenase electron transfer subunit
MRSAIMAGQIVTFFLDAAVTGLPQSVEVLPLETLTENMPWADYLALDLTDVQLPEIIARLSAVTRTPLKVEALIRTPMPCGGVGNCGLCSVHTKNGIKHACEDGPVFDWSDLVEG